MRVRNRDDERLFRKVIDQRRIEGVGVRPHNDSKVRVRKGARAAELIDRRICVPMWRRDVGRDLAAHLHHHHRIRVDVGVAGDRPGLVGRHPGGESRTACVIGRSEGGGKRSPHRFLLISNCGLLHFLKVRRRPASVQHGLAWRIDAHRGLEIPARPTGTGQRLRQIEGIRRRGEERRLARTTAFEPVESITPPWVLQAHHLRSLKLPNTLRVYDRGVSGVTRGESTYSGSVGRLLSAYRRQRRRAVTLVGFLFVVISLGSDRPRPGDDRLVQTFVTPTLIHLSVVFMIALLVLAPEGESLIPAFGLIGIAGLVYSSSIALKVVRMFPSAVTVWLFHGAIPVISYVGIVAAAWLGLTSSPSAYLVLRGVSALFLFAGMRGGWGVAVDITRRKKD